MKVFPCTACGACCSNIDGLEFLEEFNCNGVCSKLIDSKCSIYNERPQLCRIDETYDSMFSTIMSRKEFYLENAKVCNALQEKNCIPEEYRIPLDLFI